MAILVALTSCDRDCSAKPGIFFFLAPLRDVWDLSSTTRDPTSAPQPPNTPPPSGIVES